MLLQHNDRSGKLLSDVSVDEKRHYLVIDQFPDNDSARDSNSRNLKMILQDKEVTAESALVDLRNIFYVPLTWIQGAWCRPHNHTYFLKESYHRILDQCNELRPPKNNEVFAGYIYCTHEECEHEEIPIRTIRPPY